MPPKNRKIAAGKGVETSDQGSTPASASSAQDPVKVALYDGAALKSALDDCAKEVVIESGYEENTTTSNIRIAGGIISILIALYAQFGPGKFPANWWPVFWCVASYLVITTLLNAYLHRVEADSFLICKPRKSSPVGLRLSSHMERFDDKYTLIMSLGLPRNPEYREVKLTSSVTRFFHGDGYLSDAAFKPEVEKLLAEFEAGGVKKTQ